MAEHMVLANVCTCGGHTFCVARSHPLYRRTGDFEVVKKGELKVSKMDSPSQGEKRDPDGETPEGMRGHSSGAHGTARTKRESGSQSQRRGTGAKQ
jgi:hypothetical protein